MLLMCSIPSHPCPAPSSLPSAASLSTLRCSPAGARLMRHQNLCLESPSRHTRGGKVGERGPGSRRRLGARGKLCDTAPRMGLF